MPISDMKVIQLIKIFEVRRAFGKATIMSKRQLFLWMSRFNNVDMLYWNVSELIARHLRPFIFFTSLRGTLVNAKDPLPTPKQRNVVYHIPCSDCPNAYVGQTCRQLSTRVKEHEGAVRRQDENSLLALYCLTMGHAFDWDRASIIGKISEKYLIP